MEIRSHDVEPQTRDITDLQRQLTGAVASSGLRGVAEVLWEVLRRPAAVWGGMRWFSVQVRAGEPAPERLAVAPAAPHDSTFHHGGWLWHVAQPAGPESRVVVGIADPEVTARDVEYRALAAAAAVAAFEAYRMQSVAEADGRARDAGDDADDETVARSVRAQGAVVDPDGKQQHRVALVEASHMEVSELLSRVESVVRLVDRTAIVTKRDVAVVAIIASDADFAALARLMREATNNVAFGVGVSGPHRIVDDFSTAMREAEMALKIRSTIGGRMFTHFDDLSVYRILVEHGDTNELNAYVERWLAPLLAYDRVRNSELVRTLSEYLESGRSVDRAAEALFIHRSTLKYRLGRIGNLVGISLADSEACFNLQLAIRTLATVRAVRPGALAIDRGPET